MARSLNPVEKARREAKKKEIKKNKKKRLEQRLEAQKAKEEKEKEQSVKLEADRLAERPKSEPETSLNVHRGQHTFNHNKSHPGHSSRPERFLPKVDPKLARTVPAANSVIESKPIIFKPKITKFVPASVRTKIADIASSKSNTT